MNPSSLPDAKRFLVYALAALYVVAAIASPAFRGFEADRDLVWMGVLGGAAILLVAGQRLERAPRLSAWLVSLGALAGGLLLFWTVIVPIAVAVVVALSIELARRAPARA